MTGRGRLLVSEAWRSLGANLSTTVAATMTVLIGMFLLGRFCALGTSTVSSSNDVRSELLVRADFTDAAAATQRGERARLVRRSPPVRATCGIAGSLLAIFFLVLGKAIALPSILPHLSGDADVHAMAFPLVSLVLIATGLGLGAIGSGLTIRRFLQV